MPEPRDIAAEVLATDSGSLHPAKLGEIAAGRIAERFAEFGLGEVQMRVSDFAYVRAYRLVSDQRYGSYARHLSTEKQSP